MKNSPFHVFCAGGKKPFKKKGGAGPGGGPCGTRKGSWGVNGGGETWAILFFGGGKTRTRAFFRARHFGDAFPGNATFPKNFGFFYATRRREISEKQKRPWAWISEGAGGLFFRRRGKKKKRRIGAKSGPKVSLKPLTIVFRPKSPFPRGGGQKKGGGSRMRHSNRVLWAPLGSAPPTGAGLFPKDEP